MKTYLTYFDKTGDDGITTASSDHFILTSIYMPAEKWQDNFDKIRKLRKDSSESYFMMLGSKALNHDAYGLFRAAHSHNSPQYLHIVGYKFHFYAHIGAGPKVFPPLMSKHMWAQTV